MRAAVFWLPEDQDPLALAGANWLGRDAIRDIAVPQPSPKLACVTRSPARYGFHATLKPPMHLKHSLPALADDLSVLAKQLKPFPLPPLTIGTIGPALALLAVAPSPELQSLCDQCVARLDHHRAPPDEAELAGRRAAPLSEHQAAMLERWGYPYVFAEWQFHITLTSALPEKLLMPRKREAAAHFAASLAIERQVQSLALLVERETGGFFILAQRFPLGA